MPSPFTSENISLLSLWLFLDFLHKFHAVLEAVSGRRVRSAERRSQLQKILVQGQKQHQNRVPFARVGIQHKEAFFKDLGEPTRNISFWIENGIKTNRTKHPWVLFLKRAWGCAHWKSLFYKVLYLAALMCGYWEGVLMVQQRHSSFTWQANAWD